MLRGRRAECDAIEELLDRARVGQSGALVLRGDAGIGKTALLTHAIDAASGFAVVRASGIESELDLAFAGLHQLCVPLLPGLRRLPGPQQEALETAFGLSAGSPPDRFFVGLAVLGLLSDMASERPLLCVVDDRSGSMACPHRRWLSSRGDCKPSPSCCCSPRERCRPMS